MLQIQEQTVAHYGVIRLSGRFDYFGRQKFRDALKKMEQPSLAHLIVDLSEVPVIDSTPLGILVAGQKRLAHIEITMCLVIDPDTPTGQVMSHASIQTLIPTFHDLKEAISSLTSSVS